MRLSKEELLNHKEPYAVLGTSMALVEYEPVFEQLSIKEKRVLAQNTISSREEFQSIAFNEWFGENQWNALNHDNFFMEDDSFLAVLYRAYRLREDMHELLTAERPYKVLVESVEWIDLVHEFSSFALKLIINRTDDLVQRLALSTPKENRNLLAQNVRAGFCFYPNFAVSLRAALTLCNEMEGLIFGERPYEFFVNANCDVSYYKQFPQVLASVLPHTENIVNKIAATPIALRPRVLDHMEQLFPDSALLEATKMRFESFYPIRAGLFSRPVSPSDVTLTPVPSPLETSFK